MTIVNAANTNAFIRSEELKLALDKLSAVIRRDRETFSRLETIHRKVAEIPGIRFSESITGSILALRLGIEVRNANRQDNRPMEVTLPAWVMAMGKLHKAFAIPAWVYAPVS